MFKVGDKVQTDQFWSPDFHYGIVVKVFSDRLESDWILKSDGSVHRAAYSVCMHYLLENKKKGICKFLDKVQKEYAQ